MSASACRWAWYFSILASAGLSAGCDGGMEPPPATCGPALGASAQLVGCLRENGFLSQADAADADSILKDAQSVLDSLQQAAAPANYNSFGLILASTRQLEELFDAGKLVDSSRLNRMIDHVAVTLEWVREDPVPDTWGLIYPRRTPGLAWLMREGIGVYFEPELTVERHLGFVPGDAPLPGGGAALGEALWSYRRSIEGSAGPSAVWELLYSSRSCLQSVAAPRATAEAQGAILGLFTALYQSTHEAKWLARGSEAARALALPQDTGGVREADTSAGYWFQSGSGSSRIWRGHAIALVALLDFAAASGDQAAVRIGAEGLRAARHWTPEFDTGSWTRPCLTGGYSDINTHQLLVRLARALFERTGDTYWRDTADRWASYTNPFVVAGAP